MEAIFHVAYGVSDATFLFPAAAGSSVGAPLSAWASLGGLNARGVRGFVSTLPPRGGRNAGGALLGALAGGQRVSAVVEGGAQLRAVGGVLCALASRGAGSVLHVLAREDESGGVACALDVALAAADAAGAPLVAPGTPQEAHDCALAAHAEAMRASVPVVLAVCPDAEGVAAPASLLRYGALGTALAAATSAAASAAAGAPVNEASLSAALAAAGAAPVCYAGHARAEAVLLSVGGGAAAARRAAEALAAGGLRVGVLQLLQVRPFPVEALHKALPHDVAFLGGLGAVGSALAASAAAALAARRGSPCATAPALPALPKRVPLSTAVAACALRALAGGFAPGAPPPLLRGIRGARPALSLWALSGDAAGAAGDAAAARGLLRVLVAGEGGAALAAPWVSSSVAGIATGLGVASVTTLRSAPAGGDASEGVDLAVVGHPALLGAFSVVAPLRPGGALLLRLPPHLKGEPVGGGVGARAAAALEAHLPPAARAQLARCGRTLLALPPAAELGPAARIPGAEAAALQAAALHALGWSTALGSALAEEQARGVAAGASTAQLLRLHARVRESLVTAPLPAAWLSRGQGGCAMDAAAAEAEDAAAAEAAAAGGVLALWPSRAAMRTPAPPPCVTPAASAPGPVDFAPPAPPAAAPRRTAPLPEVAYAAATQKAAALSFAFPAAYAVEKAPRPHAEGTVEARVKAFQRLTPPDYDRNIFHIEFDISGTGLVYGIGAALGVHGRNDASAVAEFLAAYGVPPGALVSAPVEAGGGHGPAAPVAAAPRVALQPAAVFFEQEADIFGRATRDFYDGLSKWAREPGEAAALRALGSDGGEAAFSAREREGATFADALFDFPSARPPLPELVALLPRIKPRHYSIASSQRAHPTEVHLLVVEVEWTTPKGRRCFGQCSHYLAGLRPGAPVSVSVLTSEMHLPVDPAAPVLMAGLGTGMAPFRAFIQERACLRAAGVAVGPMTLYFGARHRASEYLYGEELELAAASGLLTLRLAFSRDTAKKVYIQHLMMEDGAALCAALNPLHGAPQGAFYLCGPTWPEPDVEEAVTRAFVDAGGIAREAAAARIVALKAAKSYVLEVY